MQHHEDAEFFRSGKHQTAENSHRNPFPQAVRRSKRVLMYWPHDDKYVAGKVKHLYQDGQITLLYGDGWKERLNFESETWKYEDLTNVAAANSNAATNSVFCGTDAELAVLEFMDYYFMNKAFLKHEAQG